ncbi:MAG: cytochrome c biogenesis protein CcsA [Phycisphaerae bacterium]|jgi:cytochrome c-type biogenesis protein CcsB|nr:cytochrome c biogenesis protein CcsA [Phycisphaerae bacterium]
MKRLTLVILLIVAAMLFPGRSASAQANDFASSINLENLGRIAVFGDGRLKSFGSHANSMMDAISGPKRINGQEAAYTYLDLLFRPEAYRDADIIYIKNRQVRESIATVLEKQPRFGADIGERMATFRKTGLISPMLLGDQTLLGLFHQLEADLIKTAKQMDAIKSAQVVCDPRFLLNRLRIVPPGSGSMDEPWHGIDEVMFVAGKTSAPSSFQMLAQQRPPLTDIDLALQANIADAWRALVNAWTNVDANGVNAATASLAELLPKVAPDLYPNQNRLEWEQWYFVKDQLTRTWIVYMFSLVLLLIGFVYRWKPAFALGCLVFAGAFALQTFALLLRWYISGRWPNANMFEAVTTSAWFGGCGAIVIEWLVRKTTMRSLFLIGSAATSMVALMTVHFLPAYLNPNISNMMPVLHDIWLYIHTNVIIFSYVLIFMAAITAGLYLVWRVFGGGPAFARAGGAGAVVLAGVGPSSIAGSAPKVSFGEVLDGVTMVLMELSFVLLWAGIAMGAIWADHSWGRPWGWDPKEVFALNTFLVFLVLVHIRLKVKDKGLWTALLAVVGAGVMLFNWIVINFVITGLHSYA